MDGNEFDGLARSLGRRLTRRRAVASLLAGFLASHAAAAADGKPGKRRGNRTRRRPNRGETQAEAACFPGRNCAPGSGKNLSRCDYAESVVLRGKNLKGTNLTSANLTAADASRANLAGANLGKACLVDADLTGATLNGSTNTGGAVFCRTTMPDGSVNDSGCTKETNCCPTCIGEGQSCGAGIGGACCEGTVCSGGQCVEACDVCPSGCPFATLGPAVDAADDGDIIRLCPGTYPTLGVIIGKDLTIVGAGDGAGGTILDGERRDLVLSIAREVTATIRDLTVTRGGVTGFDLGGGIFVGPDSTLSLQRVQVTDNANGLLGGGILVTEGATLLLTDSGVTANSLDVEGQGGGIYNQGTTTLDATRVSGNDIPDGTGGGIYNVEGGRLNLTNGSTVTENSAERGGGVGNQGVLTIGGGSTITGNTGGDCENFAMGTGCPA